MGTKIKVLIVDDSALVRQTMTEILAGDEHIEVLGAVADPYLAARAMRKEAPDVVVLDVEMPRMDGLTFLRKLMSQHPLPVVMCSSLLGKGSETALRALEYGAVDIIEKPRLGTRQFIEESSALMRDTIKAAAMSKVKRLAHSISVEPKLTADAILAKPTAHQTAMIETTEKVVVVGASTGGTEAVRIFLEALPMDAPGMVIVQHMPEHFTAAFAQRLNSICRISIKEAENNDSVLRGRVLIAPGNRHTLLRRSGARYYVEVKEGPLVCRHRPSVDVLFRSAARYAGANSVGVLMTGMGDDGARGLFEMKEARAFTMAQDEATCVVYGMPAEAVKLGAVTRVLPLERLAPEVLRVCDGA